MMTSAIPAALVTMAALTGQPRGEVLDFSATWCGPCQQMAPIVAKLERAGYPVRKVDVDSNRALAEKYGISSIPAFVLVVDGKEVTRQVGMISEQQLISMCSQIPTDPPVMLAGNESKTLPSSPSQPGGWTPNTGLTQPVAAVDEVPDEALPQQGSESPSARGLLGKLFARGKGEREPQAPDAVRAQIEDQPAETTNLLPVRDPVKASVRLHVTINGQTQVGSGTSIYSAEGQTIIATCGHLFDGWNDRSKIEVDLFLGGEPQRFVGRKLDHNSAADVGLVAIPTDSIVPTAEVAPSDNRPQVSEPVICIGCSGGATPSQEKLQVTALNYFEGPDNIECTGVPVQGRSGGGLFNRHGQLVGLCIAADAERQRGAYAGLLAIHDLLAASGMSDIYESEAPSAPMTTPESAPATAVAATDSFAPVTSQPASRGTQTAMTSEPGTSSSSGFDPFATPPGGTEVICIIQQKNGPSKVVIIDQPSPKFLSYLDGEVAARQTPVRTNRVPTSTPNHPQTSSRFTIPGDGGHTAESPSTSGDRSRSASLQPTALARPFRPQQYIRSPHTRLSE